MFQYHVNTAKSRVNELSESLRRGEELQQALREADHPLMSPIKTGTSTPLQQFTAQLARGASEQNQRRRISNETWVDEMSKQDNEQENKKEIATVISVLTPSERKYDPNKTAYTFLSAPNCNSYYLNISGTCQKSLPLVSCACLYYLLWL